VKEKAFDSEQTWALFKCAGKYILQNTSLHSEISPSRFLISRPWSEIGWPLRHREHPSGRRPARLPFEPGSVDPFAFSGKRAAFPSASL